MRGPGHLANAASAADAPASLPVLPGLDLALAATNVVHSGGDPARFATSLNAALRLLPAGQDPTPYVVLAAWRSGALAYRQAALGHVDELLGGGPSDAAAAAASLGLQVADTERVAAAQRTDRFWWPGRVANHGYVCAVGGFVGIGGAWIAPPHSGIALDEPGAFAILTGQEWWRLDADAWGHRLVPLPGEPPTAFASPVSIVCRQDSYLAWVHVAEAS